MKKTEFNSRFDNAVKRQELIESIIHDTQDSIRIKMFNDELKKLREYCRMLDSIYNEEMKDDEPLMFFLKKRVKKELSERRKQNEG